MLAQNRIYFILLFVVVVMFPLIARGWNQTLKLHGINEIGNMDYGLSNYRRIVEDGKMSVISIV